MKRNKKILTLTAKAALALSLVSVSTSALVQSNHVQAATQSTESKGFVEHIWYQRQYYHDQGTYVYYTVRRGNEVFRGYLEKMSTVPMGHNPTGIMYGGYLYNTKLKSYPIPTLASKKKMMTNFVVNDNEQLGNENKQ